MKRTRRVVQLAFVALTLVGVFVIRGNAERWCPFGGVEALYAYVREGTLLCSLGISNFYILAAVLLLALLLRRAFCGYACPIGALSEWLQAGAARLRIKAVNVPPRLDRALAKLKYVVLAIILYFTWTYSELEFRVADPCYALISRHGEDITFWAYVVSAAIVIGSLFVLIPFCRWLCPMAAVFHPLSRFGFTRIKRDDDACIGCGLCAKVCPTAIPVDRVAEVTAARCLSCLDCVDVCPEVKGGALMWGPPRRFGRRWSQGLLIALMLGVMTAAVALAYAVPLPSFTRITPDRAGPPATTATLRLEIGGLTCRGSATLLVYFLERDDEYALPGYLKIEAWPDPGPARLDVTYDPAHTDEQAIKEAITEPYFDAVGNVWRPSEFDIVGYDPLALFDDESDATDTTSSQQP